MRVCRYAAHSVSPPIRTRRPGGDIAEISVPKPPRVIRRLTARELSLFLRENLKFFQSFDRIILYYDNGQKQITRMLNSVLATELVEYDIRRVLPKDYKLFQSADLICTLALIDAKCQNGDLTKSELAVFHSKRDLYKQFIRPIRKKEFSST